MAVLDVFPTFYPRVSGLRLIIRDCPVIADFHSARYAILITQDLYTPCHVHSPVDLTYVRSAGLLFPLVQNRNFL